MLHITSSVIVAKALGLEPDGVRAKVSGTCSYCGLHIAVGDLHTPFSASPSFMDDLSLAARGSDMSCGHCAPILSAKGIIAASHGCFSASGVRPFRKWRDIAEALTNPPDEPFVMTYSTANNQHIGWRAPVNFSKELFYVRVGLRDLRIRHYYMMKAVEVSQKLAADFGYEPTAKMLASPFGTLSPDLKEIKHASLRVLNDREKKDQIPLSQPDIDFLMNMTLGESWAMRFLMTPGAGVEETPAEESTN